MDHGQAAKLRRKVDPSSDAPNPYDPSLDPSLGASEEVASLRATVARLQAEVDLRRRIDLLESELKELRQASTKLPEAS